MIKLFPRRAFLAGGLALAAGPGCGQDLPQALRPSPTTGLDAVLLAQTLEAAAGLPKLHSLIIARDGAVQAERMFRGPGLDTPVTSSRRPSRCWRRSPASPSARAC